MPIRPYIIGVTGTGLAECFTFHDSLDNFAPTITTPTPP
jgi:hypothetical protein